MKPNKLYYLCMYVYLHVCMDAQPRPVRKSRIEGDLNHEAKHKANRIYMYIDVGSPLLTSF